MNVSLAVLKLSNNDIQIELSRKHLAVGRSWGLQHNFGINELGLLRRKQTLSANSWWFQSIPQSTIPSKKSTGAMQHLEYYSNAYELIYLQHFPPSSFVTNDLTILKTWHKLFSHGTLEGWNEFCPWKWRQ